MFNESNTRPVFNESDRAYVDYNYGTFSPLNIAVRKSDYKTFVRLARNITEYTDIRVAHMCDRIHARGLA